MGRKPKLRVSFYDDVQYLLRLAHALERDTGLPKAWRMAMSNKCHSLAQEFMSAPERRTEKKAV